MTALQTPRCTCSGFFAMHGVHENCCPLYTTPTLIDRIRAVNDLTNQEEVRGLHDHLMLVNAADPRNKEMFDLARDKHIIL